MHNKVVYRLARGLRRTGSVVLRFNYRGVNLSQGEYDGGRGETEDARVALQELYTRYPHLPLIVAGFSFGLASSTSTTVICFGDWDSGSADSLSISVINGMSCSDSGTGEYPAEDCLAPPRIAAHAR